MIRWKYLLSRGKCILVILQSVNSIQERLKMIDNAGKSSSTKSHLYSRNTQSQTLLHFALESAEEDLVEFIFDTVASKIKKYIAECNYSRKK